MLSVFLPSAPLPEGMLVARSSSRGGLTSARNQALSLTVLPQFSKRKNARRRVIRRINVEPEMSASRESHHRGRACRL